jgi:hypothetical protein
MMINIESSKILPDYKERLSIAVDYYWNTRNCDIPVRKGTSIFIFENREFSIRDYDRK